MEFPVPLRQLNVSDPCVLADPRTKRYYLYSRVFACGETPRGRSGAGNKFYTLCSQDLLHWSNPILVFEQDDFWGSAEYRAPEVHYHGGNYYLFATFSAPGRLKRCQALVSGCPLGPFRPVRQEPLTPPGWSCVDGTLYIEPNGKPWLIFCHDWIQVYDGQVCALPLSADLGAAIGDPVILFRASDAPWGEKRIVTTSDGGGVTMGPCVHRMADNSLVMLWSNNAPHGLAVGLASSLSGEVTGPWVHHPVPLFDDDGGHASLFCRLDDSRLMLSLHRHGRARSIKTLLFEVAERDGWLELGGEMVFELRAVDD